MVISGGSRPHVVAANEPAVAHGVKAGMALSAALALSPQALTKVRDSKREIEALHAIAGWAEQFTPTRTVAEPQALLIEIGGCIGYFGDLAKLLKRIHTSIEDLGYRPVIATAPTAMGARLLASCGKSITVTQSAAARHALLAVPLQTIVYPAPLIAALQATGARSIGDCLKLPRDGVARRYGQALLDIIGRALGEIPDPQKPFTSPEFYSGRLELPAPVANTEALLFGLRRLINEMCGWLMGRYQGVLRLKLDLVHEDLPATSITLNLSSPTRQVDQLVLLWREKLNRLSLPERVEELLLQSLEISPLASQAKSLLPQANEQTDEICLMDRLRTRLGEDAVTALLPRADHRPEHAWQRATATKFSAPLPQSPRPVWLLPHPEVLGEQLMHDGSSPWVLMDGPERIESGWWDRDEICRDYYAARNGKGQTLWIYRDWREQGRWFLHGLFA